MRKILSNLKIPNKLVVDGKITAENATLTFGKEPSGQIVDAVLRVKIECKSIVNGIKINFNSYISHTLTKDELDELMIKFNAK